MPAAGRRPPSFLLRGAGKQLLLDCGAGATTALAGHGVTLEQLDAVLLTHLHPDHTAELVPLLFALRNPLGPPREAALPIYGPAGTAAHHTGLQTVYGDWIVPRRCPVTVQEVAPGAELCFGALTLEVFAAAHGDAALCFRASAAGRVVAFSGDSGPCEGLSAAARGADLFVCECGAAEQEAGIGHLTAREVGQLAAAAGCQRLVLTHLYPQIVASDPLARVAESFDGFAELGRDDLTLDV